MSDAIDLENEMLLITLELYDNQALPRSNIQSVVSTLIRFSSKTFMTWMKQELSKTFIGDFVSVILLLRNIVNHAHITFDKFKNEASRFQYYVSKELMIDPKTIYRLYCG